MSPSSLCLTPRVIWFCKKLLKWPYWFPSFSYLSKLFIFSSLFEKSLGAANLFLWEYSSTLILSFPVLMLLNSAVLFGLNTNVPIAKFKLIVFFFWWLNWIARSLTRYNTWCTYSPVVLHTYPIDFKLMPTISLFCANYGMESK